PSYHDVIFSNNSTSKVRMMQLGIINYINMGYLSPLGEVRSSCNLPRIPLIASKYRKIRLLREKKIGMKELISLLST
ncbi:hypothetical protein L9F63_010424, partial [Diploptera punctata]